jgi:hypothetical protein
MLAFDASDREWCAVRPAITNTPIQALILLNEVTFVEAARKLAERILRREDEAPMEKLRWAFQCVAARPPSAEEGRILLDGLHYHRRRFQAQPEAAAALLGIGEAEVDPRLDPLEAASWTAIAQLLLNLDEVLTRG